MKTLISIDPGVSSAIARLDYSDTEPARLVEVHQFRGGAEALIERFEDVRSRVALVDVIWEDFTARSTQGFSYTTDSLEPLVCIGALVALGVIDREDNLRKCTPAQQYFVGGKTKAEKVKNRRLWLNENGFKVMPKDVGQSDADDARSAISHAISWLRRQRHMPTIRHYFPEGAE